MKNSSAGSRSLSQPCRRLWRIWYRQSSRYAAETGLGCTQAPRSRPRLQIASRPRTILWTMDLDKVSQPLWFQSEYTLPSLWKVRRLGHFRKVTSRERLRKPFLVKLYASQGSDLLLCPTLWAAAIRRRVASHTHLKKCRRTWAVCLKSSNASLANIILASKPKYLRPRSFSKTRLARATMLLIQQSFKQTWKAAREPRVFMKGLLPSAWLSRSRVLFTSSRRWHRRFRKTQAGPSMERAGCTLSLRLRKLHRKF